MSNITVEKPTLFQKIQKFSWIVVLFLSFAIFFQTCSNSKKLAKMKSQIDSLATKTEIEKQIKIEGLRISKRTLFDWNSVVRTATRPDDMMHQYDVEIEKLSK